MRAVARQIKLRTQRLTSQASLARTRRTFREGAAYVATYAPDGILGFRHPIAERLPDMPHSRPLLDPHPYACFCCLAGEINRVTE